MYLLIQDVPKFRSYCEKCKMDFYPELYGVLGSCADHCGGSSGDCYCDSSCMEYGDCCFDFHNECPFVEQGSGSTFIYWVDDSIWVFRQELFPQLKLCQNRYLHFLAHLSFNQMMHMLSEVPVLGVG